MHAKKSHFKDLNEYQSKIDVQNSVHVSTVRTVHHQLVSECSNRNSDCLFMNENSMTQTIHRPPQLIEKQKRRVKCDLHSLTSEHMFTRFLIIFNLSGNVRDPIYLFIREPSSG